MIIRRSRQRADLKNVPIDGFDMFLLNLVQDGLSLAQLVEIAPRKARETLSHVLHLTQLGLLQLDFETLDEHLMFAHFAHEHCEPMEYATTGRPPAPRRVSQSHMAPVSSTPAQQPHQARAMGSFENEPTTGVRKRPEASDDSITQRAKLSGRK
jgi:hypothetical protein